MFKMTKFRPINAMRTDTIWKKKTNNNILRQTCIIERRFNDARCQIGIQYTIHNKQLKVPNWSAQQQTQTHNCRENTE